MIFNKNIFAFLLLFFSIVSIPHFVYAGELHLVSDTITNPNPNQDSDHEITFTTDTAIPVSGKIIITPKNGVFDIPSGMTALDFDLAVNSIQKTLAASPGVGSGSAIGVSAVSGSSGSITFVLNDSDTIAIGSVVSISIGTNAVIGGTGTKQIRNPVLQGSYTIALLTTNASSVAIDTKTIGIAIVPSVGIGNTYHIIGQVAVPVISPDGGVFSNPVTVNMSTDTVGASIYYTTNGATPTVSDTLYTGSFVISDTTTIKAFAILAGYTDSSIKTSIFTKYIPEAAVILPKPKPEIQECKDAIAADLNCDLVVDVVDLSILFFNWGSVRNNQRSDINKDGKVSIIDFSIIMYYWGRY